MASTVPLESVVVHPEDNVSPLKPQRAHTMPSRRAEQGLGIPSQDMPESILRQRPVPGQSLNIRVQDPDSPTSSTGPLTPSSSEDSQQTLAHSTVSPSTGTWHWFITRISGSTKPRQTSQEEEEYNKKHGYNRIQPDKIDDYPLGFGKLAAFQKSDDDWVIFRGFHQSHIRILLQYQVEITLLEEALQEMDLADSADPKKYYRNKTTLHEEGWPPEKVDLMQQLRVKITEYDDMMLKFSQIRALGRSPERDHRGLFNWVYTNKPLDKGYYNFIFHAEDFVTLEKCDEQGRRLGRSTFFADKIRSYVAKHPKSLLKTFLRPEAEIKKSSDPNVRYLSGSRLDILVRVVVVSIFVAIVLFPIFILFLVPMQRFAMVLTVLAFSSALTTTLSIATDARIQEVLVGGAAYAAVLVAFLGNMNSDCAPGAGYQ